MGLLASGSRVLLGCIVTLITAGAVVTAEDTPPLEQRVKAAFLVKFAAFVEWPATAEDSSRQSAFTLGILGHDQFGDDFGSTSKERQVNGRPIKLLRGLNLAELEGARVIFICPSESNRLEEILRQLQGKPVLTVADEPDAAKRGVMINFIKDSGKVRFEINTQAAARAGLKLSAKLLQVAITSSPPLAQHDP
jgi:hypothetical protein